MLNRREIHVMFNRCEMHFIFNSCEVHVMFHKCEIHVMFNKCEIHVMFNRCEMIAKTVFKTSESIHMSASLERAKLFFLTFFNQLIIRKKEHLSN